MYLIIGANMLDKIIENFKIEVREELRLQRVLLTAILEELKSLLVESDETTEMELSDGPICPHCGNADEDRIENTESMESPNRWTCLSIQCGESFTYEVT